MTDGIYPALGRQSGLLREMNTIAQNIANANTTGYRSESVLFSEHVVDTGRGNPSVSLAHANAQTMNLTQGAMEPTGGVLDLAIEGDGFFLVDRNGEQYLTRAGAFVLGADGGVQTVEGDPVLDAGGAPVVVPPGSDAIHIGQDGTLSADGEPLAQIGVVVPNAPDRLTRLVGTLFAAPGGTQPVETPRVMQGFLEASNVNPVLEIARMVTVQNAYELGQSFMEREDERLRSIFRLMEQ
ncbi:flagellar basal-body rod protein FlgF [Jannaschia pagri]|uniref:Flagellar basal-body rod protein FlgF n=1 Tax=Jannaschia pagri TaxID=2829797 RepID=A0ABQ4NM17_9RHOB|nr:MULTISPECIES: flagellar hook-basal body complex protein [unclassified Jannaschia]GIT91624.1 flagellar basal-body rod protein FlgF [Jannaschia sp. AI_61]GIT95458.1 flagellar basal-body rod protein FlgF [Jannaschia sp. AI_62]